MEQQALDEARAYEAAPQAHVILIDGPTSKNALNLAAKNRIADLFDALYRYPEVRAIVIIESNGIFAADTDLQEMAGFSPSDHTVWVTDWMFACRSFCDGHRIERECAGCGWAVWVEDGYCRLCWVQLSGGHAWEVTTHKTVAAMTAAGTKISHHQLFFDKMSPRNSARPQAAAAWQATADAAAPGRTWVQPGDGGVVEVAGKTCLGHQVGHSRETAIGRFMTAHEALGRGPVNRSSTLGRLETAVAAARDWAAVEPLAIVASEHLFYHAADLPTGMRCRRPGHHGDLETARMIRHGSAPHRTTGPDSQSVM